MQVATRSVITKLKEEFQVCVGRMLYDCIQCNTDKLKIVTKEHTDDEVTVDIDIHKTVTVNSTEVRA